MKEEKSRLDVTPGAALLYPVLYFLDREGWFSAAIPAILFHELGHWAALRGCGMAVREVRLDLAGLRMDTGPFSDGKREFLCLIAGPLTGLLWALAAFRLGGPFGAKSAMAALALNGINLLPALPLDGGRILSLLVSESVVRVSTALCAAVLLTAALRWRIWGLLAPAALLGKNALIA